MRVARDGWRFIGICVVVAALFQIVGALAQYHWMAYVSGLAWLGACYCAYFFRDPRRTIPQGASLILSPADGKVVEVIQIEEAGSRVWLVRIFLSVFDVHLQRAPVAGRVQTVKYKKGKFLDARDVKAHFENEQNRIELAADGGAAQSPVVVTQIAGLIARRIVCWLKPGQPLTAGEQIGLIRFGSQVDITFPMSAKVRTKLGDRVVGGETILAEFA